MNAILLGTAVLISAPGLKEPPKKDQGIVGEWELQASSLTGKKGATPAPDMVYQFTADGKWLMRRHGVEVKTTPRDFKVNAKAKPATIDVVFHLASGVAAPQRNDVLGIYKIEGDTLTLCFSPRGDAVRPTSFDQNGSIRSIVLTLKRAKKEK